MDQQKNMKIRQIEHYLGVLIFGFILGGIFSFTYFSQAKNNSYQAGFDAAKKVVIESGFGGSLITNQDIKVLSGKVVAVDGNRVSIKAQLTSPFDDASLSNRVVIVNNDTRIYNLSLKDSKTMQAEMDEFMKNLRTDKEAVPPEPFTTSPASLQDIKVGDNINVISLVNIKNLTEFEVSEIQIQLKSAN